MFAELLSACLSLALSVVVLPVSLVDSVVVFADEDDALVVAAEELEAALSSVVAVEEEVDSVFGFSLVADSALLLLLLEVAAEPDLALILEMSSLWAASLLGLLFGLTVVLMAVNALTNRIKETIAVGEISGGVRYAMVDPPKKIRCPENLARFMIINAFMRSYLRGFVKILQHIYCDTSQKLCQ